MAAADLNANVLREHLSYNADTGLFTRIRNSGTAKVGDIAGWLEPSGYIKFSIDGRKQYAHRCAILFATGDWPAECVDHIDGNKANNALRNLRAVSMQVNLQNLKRARIDNAAGLLGVCFNKGAGKYMAECKGPDGKRHYLGLHATADEAHAAYLKAKRQLHKGCTI